MDKKLTYTLIGGIVVISLSVAYYLIIFLPEQERSKIELQKQEQRAKESKEEALFVKKIECQEAGEKRHEDTKEGIAAYTSIPPKSPEYKYIKDKGTCIYSSGVILDEASDARVEWVLDSLTGERILYYENPRIREDDCSHCVATFDEYKTKKAELFTD